MARARKDDATALIEMLEAAEPASRNSGVLLGRLIAVRGDRAFVSLKGQESRPSIRARMLTPLSSDDEGHEVALMFENADPDQAFVVGCVRSQELVEPPGEKVPLEVDADAIVLKADREIILRCGEASIVLKKDGRVVIRGTYVETRSNGVNRIKGGSVQIN